MYICHLQKVVNVTDLSMAGIFIYLGNTTFSALQTQGFLTSTLRIKKTLTLEKKRQLLFKQDLARA